MSLNEDLEMLVKFLESEDFKRAKEISRRSITEMIEMQDKTKKYDELKPKLENLRDDVWNVMAQSDIHNPNLFAIYTRLGDIISSIYTSEKRKEKEE